MGDRSRMPLPFMRRSNRLSLPPCPAGLALFASLAGSLCLLLLGTSLCRAQDTDAEGIVVTGDTVPSAYGAPGGFSRSRFSPTTAAYVLPPWHFYFGEIYEG